MSRSPELYRRCEDLGLAFIKALDIKLPVRAFSIHFEAGQFPTVRVEHFVEAVPKDADDLSTRLTSFRLVPDTDVANGGPASPAPEPAAPAAGEVAHAA